MGIFDESLVTLCDLDHVKRRRQGTYNVTLSRVRVTCYRGKAISIKYYECVCILALLSWMESASLLRSIILSCVACPALPYFSTLSHKRQDFRGGKIIEHKIFYTNLSETFLILKIITLGVIINVHRSSCKVPFILVRFK